MNLVPCIGCGASFPQRDGPTHRYMESSPGCWAAFGEVLAREYSDPSYSRVHRLTVDAYAVQHPGRPSPQSIQSVALHLISLCLTLEQGIDDMFTATDSIRAAAETKHRFRWLPPPPSLGAITIADVVGSSNGEDHERRVRVWAAAAWTAWSEHHGVIRGWLPKAR
jgi:hypothetical protein